MIDILQVADQADMIINGYAFTVAGDTVLQNRGILNDREIEKIRSFIKINYQEMYLKWAQYSQQGFYNN